MSRGSGPGSADTVMAALDALDAVLDGLVEAPLWRLSLEQVGEFVRRLARAENRVVAAQVAAVGEGVSRGLHTLSGSKTGAAWLRGLVPVAPHVAFQRGGVAVELPAEAMAPVREAFAAGALSVGHAAVVTRTLGALDRVWSIDSATWSDA